MPIGDVSLRRKGKSIVVIGEDYATPLISASSGLHSIIPLFLVTKYLVDIVRGGLSKSQKKLSLYENQEIKKKIAEIISNDKLSEEIKKTLLESLSGNYRYDALVNIVEEPEQNLYPSSQGKLLWELLAANNLIEDNKLIITTHSPYIINYLTLAVKAHQLYDQKENFDITLPVPRESSVSGKHVKIYQLIDGKINLLPNYHNLPSDENLLNDHLDSFNQIFTEMLEAELG